MKSAILAIAMLLPIFIYSQTTFQKGYFIQNDGQRKEVLIKNLDWSNNPTSFEYKTTDDASVETTTMAKVTEFGIDGVSKYTRATVDMDLATKRHGNLPRTRIPEFTKKTAFLKVLSEGKETLYAYDDNGVNLFFYKTDADSIKQLIYRKYVGKNNALLENVAYRTQLKAEVNCATDDKSAKIERLKYNRDDLTDYFDEINSCGGLSPSATEQPVATTKLARKKGVLNFSPAVGYNLYKGEIDHPVDSRDLSFSKSGVSIGLEIEYVLPTNNGKLSIIFEPTYHSIGKVEQTNTINTVLDEHMTLKYNLLKFPLGVRWRFFISPDSQIFVNGVFNYGMVLNNEIEMTQSNNLGIFTSTYTFGAGVGFAYKRFAAEARFSSSAGLVSNQNVSSSIQIGPNFIFRYNIFKR
ncbi:MAG: hypothetical protein EOO50_08945 [Flavobacterium sp.]|uniref:hypothetical protein n=1 Tax=Flavobacterium sp. TaxID=239 RepID=UPI0012107393|nr:hypothetical protein [Flavobacterium sp.]RZJ66642.1 MAG: hypothetical protein EOO50_08945 [Flavobacterium sp.]